MYMYSTVFNSCLFTYGEVIEGFAGRGLLHRRVSMVACGKEHLFGTLVVDIGTDVVAAAALRAAPVGHHRLKHLRTGPPLILLHPLQVLLKHQLFCIPFSAVCCSRVRHSTRFFRRRSWSRRLLSPPADCIACFVLDYPLYIEEREGGE